MITKYVKIDGVVRYFPNGYEAAKGVATKPAPKKDKSKSKSK